MRKKIFLGLLAFCVALWIAASLVDARYYGVFLAKKFEKVARSNGVQLAIAQMDWRSWRLTGSQMAITSLVGKGFPIILKIDTFDINLRPWRLLLGELSLNGNFKLYGGSLLANTTLNFFSKRLQLAAQAKNIKLSEHPQLTGLGLTAGNLSFNLKELIVDQPLLLIKDLNLDISDLQKSGETVLSPNLTGLPLPIKIPEVSDLHLTGLINQNVKTLTIENLDNSSSWGTLSGQLACNLEALPPARCSGHFDGALSSSGVEHWGPFLTLLSSGKLQSGTNKFTMVIENNVPAF